MIDDKIKLESDICSQSEKKPKWRNVIFDKNGKTHFGMFLHNTKEIAEKGQQECLGLARKRIANGEKIIVIRTLNDTYCFHEYSWHMQVPIL